jgi:hypothetical protein
MEYAPGRCGQGAVLSDILVLSFAYTTDGSKWRALRNSCMKHRVPLHVMGQGQHHPGPCGFEEAAEFLKERSEEYIVITDSFDVICNRWDEDELRMLIDSAPNLIVACDPYTWPFEYAPLYEHLAKRYKWFSPCGGQYAGRRRQVIAMWEEMMRLWAAGVAIHGGTSQELLTLMYNGKGFTLWPFILDLECRLFQSMIEPHARYIMKTFRPHGQEPLWVAQNTITKSYPMFLHFNGQKANLSPSFEEWKKILS